jgi:beta-lactam-binding protein with PASTA domain
VPAHAGQRQKHHVPGRPLDLRGDDAAANLEAAGLRFYAYKLLQPSQTSSEGLSMTTKQSLAGVVVAQSPSPGISVRVGSTVELSVEHDPTG